jgi:indolepyruvate ferredoxin oxidoreductase
LRKAAGKTAETIDPATLPMPVLREFADSYSVLIAGIGGNGVVTIGAIIGMAAHLEDKSVTVLDMSGLAQRNGPVTSHVRILKGGQDTHAPRIPERAADLVLGCDLVVASNAECVSKMDQARTSVIYNRFVAPTSAFATNPNLDFSDANLAAAITRKVEPRHVDGIDATRVAVKMLGDAIGANMFLVGYAWQRGLLPLSLEALEGAIRMNGAAVPLNLSAFNYGRAAALDPARVQAWLDDSEAKSKGRASLDDIVSDRAATLTAFQDEALAARYRALVERVRKAERGVLGVDGALSEAVAKGYFKSLYFKDEYEVGRLYSDGSLERRLSETFEGDLKISFNLAPPLIARRGPDGREKKMQFGAWIKPGFGVLAKLKSLRGGAFDIFGYSTHRKTERALGAEYEALIEMLLPRIEKSDVARLAAIAAEYENVKGYGVVKEEKLEAARKRVRDALAELDAPLAVPARRAEAVG